jgi:hypothetical protein
MRYLVTLLRDESADGSPRYVDASVTPRILAAYAAARFHRAASVAAGPNAPCLAYALPCGEYVDVVACDVADCPVYDSVRFIRLERTGVIALHEARFTSLLHAFGFRSQPDVAVDDDYSRLYRAIERGGPLRPRDYTLIARDPRLSALAHSVMNRVRAGGV